MKIAAVIKAIEDYANPSIQEKWDNSGLQLGSTLTECTGVLVCLDPTVEVVNEAIAKGCNLIVSHHPLFFKPIKRLTGATQVEAVAINAIAAGISIYSSHTAADSTPGGVSYLMAQKLGVEPIKTLAPLADQLVGLQVMVPEDKAYMVEAALFDAGAGKVGNYDHCCFNVKGQGTFRPLSGSNPYIGEQGEETEVAEVQINVVLTRDLMSRVEKALLEVHPYETPAYSFVPMLNKVSNTGLGVYGTLDPALTPQEFVAKVKEAFGCKAVRATKVDFCADFKIRRVALCGGAGGEFIPTALFMGAQAYVTADVRYHDFVDYRDRILVIDAGHFETEAPVKECFSLVIKDRFPDIPVFCTAADDNPIDYL